MWGWVEALVRGVLGTLTAWLQQRQHDADQRSLGETSANLETSIAGQQEVTEARSAASDMSAAIAADPGELRRPDKYQRAD
jgi:hypothetical protein